MYGIYLWIFTMYGDPPRSSFESSLAATEVGLRPVNQKGVTLYILVMSIDGNPVLKQPEWQMVQIHHLVAKPRPSSLNGFRKRMPVHQRPCQLDM